MMREKHLILSRDFCRENRWHLFPGCALILAIWITLLPSSASNAQNNPPDNQALQAGIQFVETPVSASEIPVRLKTGDWKVMSREEYQQLRDYFRHHAAGPRKTWIEKGVYRATLEGDTLNRGTMQADIRRSGTTDELLSLAPLNLAVSSARWADDDAIWGSAPDGKPTVLVDKSARQFQADWSLKGRQLSRSIEFDFRVAPAAVSIIQLLVPDKSRLLVSSGEMTRSRSQDKSGWNEWTILLGRENRTRITVVPSSEPVRQQKLTFTQSHLLYVARSAEMEIKADFVVDVINVPVSTLEFRLPPAVKVHAVNYGTDTNLTWQSSLAGKQQKLVVTLPDPLLGRSRRIRIDCALPVVQSRSWKLPKVQLSNSIFLDGTFELVVESPLVLRKFSITDGVQQTATTKTEQVERVKFSQFAASSQLEIEVGQPNLILAATSVNHFLYDSEQWSLSSEIQWQAQAGTTFRARCILPAGWDVIEVEPVRPVANRGLANWEVRQRQDKSTELTLHFSTSLKPGTTHTVVIRSQLARSMSTPLIAMPIAIPVECDRADVILSFPDDGPDTPTPNELTTLQKIDQASVPAYATESHLWQQMAEDLTPRSHYFIGNLAGRNAETTADFLAGVGHILIANRNIPTLAEVVVVASVNQRDLLEEFAIQLDPQGRAIDRFHLYLTESDKSLSWELREADETLRIRTSQLPTSRHQEFNLPPAGELWLVQLSNLQRSPFAIHGRRARTIGANAKLTLVFTPDIALQSTALTLTSSPGTKVAVQPSDGVVKVEANALTDTLRRHVTETSDAQIWSYQNRDDEFNLSVEQTAGPTSQAPPALMSLRSMLAPDALMDSHIAIYELDENASRKRFRFQIPEPGTLVRVNLNDIPVDLTKEDSLWLLPPLPGDRRNRIEIEYQITRTKRLQLPFLSQEIVFPQTSLNIVDFQWTFGMPSGFGLRAEPRGVVIAEALPHAGWNERFFGPMGRLAETPLFNPFSVKSWQLLFSSDDDLADESRIEVSETAAVSDIDAQFPQGWTVLHARAPMQPKSLSIPLWNISTTRQFGWICLLTCLVIGVVIRKMKLKIRASVGAIMLSLSVVAIWLLHPAYSTLAGSCLVGTIIASLLPRQALTNLRTAPKPTRDISVGSTASFQHVPGILLLIGGTITMGTAVIAQETDPSPTVFDTTPLRSVSKPGIFEVLIPREDSEVVYVPARLDRLWTEAEAATKSAPQILMRSATYSGKISSPVSIELDAVFRVIILQGPNQPSFIRIPIQRANLGGPDSCQVDGKPQSVLLAPKGGGYLIPIPSQKEDEDGHRELEIRLHLFPALDVDASGFRMSIPPSISTQARFQIPESLERFEIVVPQGIVQRLPQKREVNTHIGVQSTLAARWPRENKTSPETNRSLLEAKITSLAEVHPSFVQFRTRVDYEVRQGSVDYVIWTIPKNAVVRSITSENLSRFSVYPEKNDTSIIIEFARAQSVPFSIDAVLTIPQTQQPPVSGTFSAEIPAIDLVASKSKFQPRSSTIALSHSLGINAMSGFHLEPSENQPQDAVPMLPRSFGERTVIDISPVLPRLAYQMTAPVPLRFQLTPMQPLRQVRMFQSAQISRRKFQWEMRAEFKTSVAPAFRHRIRVPQNILIEEITVVEDGARRLARWTRNGDILDLFLNGRTTGTQEVLLKGHAAVSAPYEFALPKIDVLNAVIEESIIHLQHDDDVLVELVDRKLWTKVKRTEEAMPTIDTDITRLGQFRILSNDRIFRIRCTPKNELLELDTAIILDDRAPGYNQFLQILRFRELRDDVEEVRVSVPHQLGTSVEFEPQEIIKATTPLPDGGIEATLETRATESFAFLVRARLPKIFEGGADLPVVNTTDASTITRYLMLPTNSALQPGRESITSFPTDQLPGWILNEESVAKERDLWQTFRTTDGRWSLSESTSVQRNPLFSPSALTEIWTLDKGQLAGKTTLLMSRYPNQEISITIPASLKLQSVQVNGRFIDATQPSDSQVSIALGSFSESVILTIHWLSAFSDHHVPTLGPLQFPLPLPNDLPVELSIVELNGPNHRFFLARGSGIEVQNDLSIGILRAEKILSLLQTLAQIDAYHRALLDTTLKELQAIGHRLQDETQRERVSAKLLTTFRRVHDELELLQGRVVTGNTPQSSRQVGLLLDRHPREENRVRSMQSMTFAATSSTPLRRVSLWVFDARWIRYGFAIAMFVAVLVFSRKLFRVESGRWLSTHQFISWSLLGMIWWLFLIPSAAGWLFMIAALVSAIRRHRVEESPSQWSETRQFPFPSA